MRQENVFISLDTGFAGMCFKTVEHVKIEWNCIKFKYIGGVAIKRKRKRHDVLSSHFYILSPERS